MYLGRIDSIANRLESIEEKLRLSKSKKDEMIRKVEEAKINAANLIQTAKKEADLLCQKVKTDSQNEILNLEKAFAEQKDFEQRKMTRAVVSELLGELFSQDSLKVDQNEFINIILKKVG